MAKLAWKFLTVPALVDLSSQVQSFSRFRGKQNYLDDYSGQQMTLTIRNNTNQIASWPIGQGIYIYPASAPQDGQTFWVSEVQFNDQQGTTTTAGSGAASTATVILDDWMTRAGRIQLTNFTLTTDFCLKQMYNQITTASGALPADMGWTPTTVGFFSALGGTYTGTVAARINQNLKTEAWGAQLYQQAERMNLRAGRIFGDPINNAVTLQPAKNGSTGNKYVQYQSFRRISAGQNFINTVTVVPPVAAPQTKTNPSSVTTYGTRFNSVSTQNIDITQAANRASWLANAQSNPNDLRYEVTFTDVQQDNTGVESLLNNYFSGSFIYLKYVVPGSGVTTTINCSIEGISYSATPEQTVFTVYLSLMDLYSDFILNNAMFGVLGQSRLGQFY